MNTTAEVNLPSTRGKIRVEGNDGWLAVKLEEGHIAEVRTFSVVNHWCVYILTDEDEGIYSMVKVR